MLPPVLAGTARPRSEKPVPPSVDWLGWCSWDAYVTPSFASGASGPWVSTACSLRRSAPVSMLHRSSSPPRQPPPPSHPTRRFYSRVSAAGLQAGLKSLAAGGTAPRFLIIDDGGWVGQRARACGAASARTWLAVFLTPLPLNAHPTPLPCRAGWQRTDTDPEYRSAAAAGSVQGTGSVQGAATGGAGLGSALADVEEAAAALADPHTAQREQAAKGAQPAAATSSAAGSGSSAVAGGGGLLASLAAWARAAYCRLAALAARLDVELFGWARALLKATPANHWRMVRGPGRALPALHRRRCPLSHHSVLPPTHRSACCLRWRAAPWSGRTGSSTMPQRQVGAG